MGFHAAGRLSWIMWDHDEATSWDEWVSPGVGCGKVGRGCVVSEVPSDLVVSWKHHFSCSSIFNHVTLSKSLNFPEP